MFQARKAESNCQDPATDVLFRQCHLPLPWSGICSAPLLQVGAWGGLVPHRERRRHLRSVASALENVLRIPGPSDAHFSH